VPSAADCSSVWCIHLNNKHTSLVCWLAVCHSGSCLPSYNAHSHSDSWCLVSLHFASPILLQCTM
jgi:hypothetical protein